MRPIILLVEDDQDAREVYGEALRDRGFYVLTAKHGAEGVHLARRHRPHLIIMDIRMPLMDGWQAMSYMRMDRSTVSTPIWAVSAYFDEEEEKKPLQRKGFDRLIPKPISPSDLVDEVVAYLGAPLPRPE